MDELIDIFNQNYEHIGTAQKSKAHSEGIWHQTFHCWMTRQREDMLFILVQKRADSKEDSPGMLDVSAAGHLRAGEIKEEGVREIKEELGVDVLAHDLLYLGMRVAEYQYKKLINKEFNHVYLLIDTTPLHSYKLQKNEVKSLLEININDFTDLFMGRVNSIQCSELTCDNENRHIALTEVCKDDFIYRSDSYYLKICHTALEYFSGVKIGLQWQLDLLHNVQG